MTEGSGHPSSEGKTVPVASSITAARQAGFSVIAQSSKDECAHGIPIDPADLTLGDLAVFSDSAAIVTGPGQLRHDDGRPLSVDHAVTRADFKGFFRPTVPTPHFAPPHSAAPIPVDNASQEKDSVSDMVDAISEIGREMVDQLIDGIREHCASKPNPLLAPQRHFFRELGSGLVAMSHDDLLTLCAAAITRIAYPELFAAH